MKPIIRKYSENDKDIWNSFIETSKINLFMFNRNYMEYHSDRFNDYSLLFYNGDKLTGIIPACIEGDILISHGGLTYGGFITNSDMRQTIMMDCMKSLIEYCKENGITSLLYKSIPDIYHNQPAEEDIYALYNMGAKIVKVEASTVINLKNPIKMSKLRKRQSNKAIRKGAKIGIDDSVETYNEFMNLQDRILIERHNVHAVHTGAEMYLLHSRFPDNIHLYAARLHGKLLGGSVVFIYDNVIHTQYLCSNEEAKEIGALDATVFRIMEDYKDNKQWLDFGISTEDSGYYLNEGLISQKEGFGGRTKVYMTWKVDFESKMRV